VSYGAISLCHVIVSFLPPKRVGLKSNDQIAHHHCFPEQARSKASSRIQGPDHTHDRRSWKINKLSPCSSSMYFSLDPGSTYEASLQRVQENKTTLVIRNCPPSKRLALKRNNNYYPLLDAAKLRGNLKNLFAFPFRSSHFFTRRAMMMRDSCH
jgi:hypothetical protein